MGHNEIKSVLSISSLLALVIALVCYFSNSYKTAVILLIVGVVLKVAELILRFTHKRQ